MQKKGKEGRGLLKSLQHHSPLHNSPPISRWIGCQPRYYDDPWDERTKERRGRWWCVGKAECAAAAAGKETPPIIHPSHPDFDRLMFWEKTTTEPKGQRFCLHHHRANEIELTEGGGRGNNVHLRTQWKYPPPPLLSSLLQVGSFACLGPYSFHLR